MKVRLALSSMLLPLMFMTGIRISTAAKPCSNISTVWTLASYYVDGTTASRVYSDGLSYVDGERGVSAYIVICGQNPSYDAVLNLQAPLPKVNSSRPVMFNFQDALVGAAYNPLPAWVSAEPLAGRNVVLNIRNILGVGTCSTCSRSVEYVLSTNFGSGFIAPDGSTYHLRMNDSFNPDVSRAVVHHFPANGTQQEYWLVYPEAQLAGEVGHLLSEDRTVDYGAFSMPFSFTITVK